MAFVYWLATNNKWLQQDGPHGFKKYIHKKYEDFERVWEDIKTSQNLVEI